MKTLGTHSPEYGMVQAPQMPTELGSRDLHFQPGPREYTRASLSLAFPLVVVIENANTRLVNPSLPQSRLGRPFWPLRRVTPSTREGVP